MKIFIDAHFLDGRKHGVAIYLDRLYSQYRQLQPNDELYFGIEPTVFADYPLFKLPRVHVLRYRFGGGLRFLYDIPHLVRQVGADVVHTQYVLPLRIGYSALRHVTIHDVLYEDFPDLFSVIYRWSRKIIFGWSARQADMVSTISEYSRDRVTALYRPKAAQIHIVYPGVVDDETLDIPAIDSGQRENNILYVSRFERRKNHLTLLRAFVILRVKNPGLRLILVGFEVDGSLAIVRSFISKHGLDSHVDIMGNITDAQLQTLYRTAGVVVYPSLGEGFGMPVIESFLLNPYTYYSNVTAMAEFSFAPDNTFSPTDENAIAQKIGLGLLESSTNPASWEGQRRSVVQKYNWRRSALVLADIHHQNSAAPAMP